jgi:hypothetical protein
VRRFIPSKGRHELQLADETAKILAIKPVRHSLLLFIFHLFPVFWLSFFGAFLCFCLGEYGTINRLPGPRYRHCSRARQRGRSTTTLHRHCL